MYHDDHSPPHFHAFYGGDEAEIDIRTLNVRRGFLPRRALAMTLEWAAFHREGLKRNWRRTQEHKPLLKIKPLE
jgi:hypothetical protein